MRVMTGKQLDLKNIRTYVHTDIAEMKKWELLSALKWTFYSIGCLMQNFFSHSHVELLNQYIKIEFQFA